MRVFESNIRLLICPESLKSGITEYATSLCDLIADDLLGVYLYGSVARGCYHPNGSDLDVIVVVSDDWVEAEQSSILRIHADTGVPVDPVFVTESQLKSDVFPTPVAFLVKPIAGCTIVRPPDGSKDFLLQRQDAYEAGVALVGPDPKHLMHPVPWPLLAASLDFLFPYIVSHFKNSVLMLSRLVSAWERHHLCSKREAGEWAIGAFGRQWSDVLQMALAEYAANGSAQTAIPSDVVKAFEAYCAERIDRARALAYEAVAGHG